jgi:hypothetical protein
MSEEFRTMIAAAADLQEDEVSFDSISKMSLQLRCDSIAPISTVVPVNAPRATRELAEWCEERIAKPGLEVVPAIRAARVAAVRSAAHLELWIARRCGAMRRGGYLAESESLLARSAPATTRHGANWSDADTLAAQPWLLESIDGSVSGVIFNHADMFSGFAVRDVLHAWALSLVLDASREDDVGRTLALMCEAAQALNYAGFMDGCDAGEEVYRDSGVKPSSEFAIAAARKAADARHVENRSMKAQVLAWYAAHGSEYASKDDAALAATTLVPMKFSTIRNWLTSTNCGL